MVLRIFQSFPELDFRFQSQRFRKQSNYIFFASTNSGIFMVKIILLVFSWRLFMVDHDLLHVFIEFWSNACCR